MRPPNKKKSYQYKSLQSFKVKILLAPGASAGNRLGLPRPRCEHGNRFKVLLTQGVSAGS